MRVGGSAPIRVWGDTGGRETPTRTFKPTEIISAATKEVSLKLRQLAIGNDTNKTKDNQKGKEQ